VIVSGAQLAGEGRMRWVSGVLGDLSFPLYILHWPILKICAYWLPRFGIEGPATVVSSLACAFLLSCVIFATFDKPVRAALSTMTVRRMGIRGGFLTVREGNRMDGTAGLSRSSSSRR
jgi:peptidoglycan/LPS O-acetylase OafA/YrhL